MPLYEAVGTAMAKYVVNADDEEQAIDFFFDMVKEDFTDAEAYDVSNIVRIEID